MLTSRKGTRLSDMFVQNYNNSTIGVPYELPYICAAIEYN